MAEVVAVCGSQTRGVRKENIQKGILRAGFGLEGDCSC